VADPPVIPSIADVSTIAGIAGVSTVAPIQPSGRSVPGASTAKGKSTAVAVGAYWINHYKRCRQNRTDFCNAIAGGFAGAMHALGHSVAFVRGEDDASPKQWAAPTDQSVNGIDTVEFAILATHSGTHGLERSGSRWLFWWLGTFDSADGCIVSTIKLDAMWRPVTPDTPVVTMNLGEGRLRYAVLDGCRSLQLGVKNERDEGAQAQLAESDPAKTWGRCFDGVTMLFGFTGLSSDAAWTSQRGASFGHRAGRGEPLGDSWIDEAYAWWTDDVPVAMACGRSKEDARRRVNGESLKVVGQRLRSADIGGYFWIWRS
jgi:hypothetical protein